jgi:hypothetical protein
MIVAHKVEIICKQHAHAIGVIAQTYSTLSRPPMKKA